MGTDEAAAAGVAGNATGCQKACAGRTAEEKELAFEEKEGGTCDESYYGGSGVRHDDD